MSIHAAGAPRPAPAESSVSSSARSPRLTSATVSRSAWTSWRSRANHTTRAAGARSSRRRRARSSGGRRGCLVRAEVAESGRRVAMRQAGDWVLAVGAEAEERRGGRGASAMGSPDESPRRGLRRSSAGSTTATPRDSPGVSGPSRPPYPAIARDTRSRHRGREPSLPMRRRGQGLLPLKRRPLPRARNRSETTRKEFLKTIPRPTSRDVLSFRRPAAPTRSFACIFRMRSSTAVACASSVATVRSSSPTLASTSPTRRGAARLARLSFGAHPKTPPTPPSRRQTTRTSPPPPRSVSPTDQSRTMSP